MIASIPKPLLICEGNMDTEELDILRRSSVHVI